jgi:hypothetical protein
MEWSRLPAWYLSMKVAWLANRFPIWSEGGGYLSEFLLGLVVEGQEGFLFLADEHEAVVIVTLEVGGELDVGDQEVLVLILNSELRTCSSLVLNQSLAFPYLTGILIKYCCNQPHNPFYFQQQIPQPHNAPPHPKEQQGCNNRFRDSCLGVVYPSRSRISAKQGNQFI